MTQSDDNIIVRRVLEGNTEAFRALVERHRQQIFYLGMKFFHNPEEAEDFTQDVFLRAYDKLILFGGHVPFGAWLYRVAFNLAISKYHVNRRSLMINIDDIEPVSNDMLPETALLDSEAKDTINAVVATLPEIYQIVIKMSYYDGLTYPEISKVTGIPVNTIKSYILRSKELLRKKLGFVMKEGLQ